MNGERVASAENAAEASVVLDRTPLYAEMGGQLGDHGLIDTADAQFFVSNTVSKGGLYVHEGKLIGKLSEGDTVFAGYDLNRRGLLARNHTATHLLDAALKEVLGDHVNQAGSLVSPEALRFDFTHFEAMTSEQIRAVEDLVNEQILAAKPVVTRVMGIEEAKAPAPSPCSARSTATPSASSPSAPRTSRSPASCAVAPMRATPPSSVCSRSSPSLPPAPMSAASRL